MFTDIEIQQILTNLRKQSSENELVEFKAARNSFSKTVIGEYFSALANEANLKGKPFAWLVFGVENSKHEIIGSDAFQDESSLQDLKREIADQTLNRITFIEIYVVRIDGKRVVLFQIPAAPLGYPVTWKGHYYGRDHEALVPLNLEEIERIRNQGRSFRFEREIAMYNCSFAEVESLLILDSFFQDLKLPRPVNITNVIDRLVSEGILTKGSTQEVCNITNLGAILYARNLSSFPELKRKTLRLVIYSGPNKLKTIKSQEFMKGYAAGFDEMLGYINNQLPQNEVITDGRRETVRMYPVLAVRELLANALIHQDFLQSGTNPMVEIFTDRIEITNNGLPLIDPQRFIDEAPKSRNEELASFMRRIGLCEELGSGIDKVVYEIENIHLPAPLFQVKTSHTIATLFSYRPLRQITQEEKLRACYQHACLRYILTEKLTNESLRNRFQIPDENYAIISRLIRDALKAGLIKEFDPVNKSRKYAGYVPFWA